MNSVVDYFSPRLDRIVARSLSGVVFSLVLATQQWSAVAQEPNHVISVSPDAASSAKYDQSRVIVRFRNQASFLPGTPNSRGLGAAGLFLADLPPGLSVAESVRNYKANPNVLYAEPDYIVDGLDTPTDPLWGQQWDMVKIAAPAAWSLTTGASDVIVAVVDTGVDYTHPDLAANLWTNPVDGSHGFTCINGPCVSGGKDDYGHGTHVAGTIGAVANNGTGIAGINWRVQILSCKFLASNGSGNLSDAISCFNQILALKQQGYNIRVTSNSWGGGDFSQSLKDTMAALESAGILHVCAAGNSAVNADMSPMYPGAFDNRGIVSVLATDQNDLGAWFTNYGLATADIAAPGVNTLSTVPTGTCSLCDPSGYRVASGTSMATPHVSAVLAAMLHLHPELTPYQARDVLLDPGSYDPVSDFVGSQSSTGGRLNFQKAITNPLLSAPKLNNFPAVAGMSNVVASAGSAINVVATGSDPDNDPLRVSLSTAGLDSYGLFGWMASSLFPAAAGSTVSFQAPSLARTALAQYTASVSDGRGGSATAPSYVTVQPASAAGNPPSGSLTVSPLSGPVGTTVSVNYAASDPEGGPVGWDLWLTGNAGSGNCCFTASSTSFQLTAAGVYRVTVQSIDRELNLSDRPTAVVRIGGATGTPPIARATFDKMSGAAPLTVNIDMSSSTDPDGTIQSYITNCNWGTSGIAYSGVRTSCTYTTPGTYWIILQVIDNAGLLDVFPAYIVVTPPGTGTSKQPASVTLTNLTQNYTGSQLAPSATTNPPGLTITWTNAPQTAAGAYTVTATVNDPNYQGSATGTFTINKPAASVTLSNLTQTYTGSPLAPTATTNPPGLAITWTNAPQTAAGAYTVTATINDPNYQGSATGTFTINKPAASVTLSNLIQTYTGSQLAPTATTNPPGLAITWTNAPQTAAGAYTVTAMINDPNYQGSATGTFTINKPAASVTLSNLIQTYTGSPLAPTATTNPPGLAITWTNAPQTAAGAYTVTATINDPNYQGSATGTFTINKPAASVTLSNLTQTYTGSPLAPTATTNPAGLAITWTNAPQTAAGVYTVTATINDPNYQGSATGTFTINKSAASVTLSNLTQTYTGSQLKPNATTNPPGLAVSWTNAPQTNAGSYSVTATVTDPNYSGSATGTFTIGKATASLVLSNLTQTYTGNALTPAASTTPPGLAVAWTNAPEVNTGTYAVTASINNPNYQGTATGTFTINPASTVTPPSVAITSPASGSVPSKKTVSIQANVTVGTNPVARVDFLVNGSVACSDTAAPYVCSWNVPSATGKSYQLQVKAYDTAGQTGTSAIVSVTSSR